MQVRGLSPPCPCPCVYYSMDTLSVSRGRQKHPEYPGQDSTHDVPPVPSQPCTRAERERSGVPRSAAYHVVGVR